MRTSRSAPANFGARDLATCHNGRAQIRFVEQERQRLLVEHAARLKEFLPKGVLAKPEGLDLINTVRASSTGGLGSTRAGSRAAGSRAFEM